MFPLVVIIDFILSGHFELIKSKSPSKTNLIKKDIKKNTFFYDSIIKSNTPNKRVEVEDVDSDCQLDNIMFDFEDDFIGL